MKLGNVKDLAIVGAVLGVGYFVYKTFGAVPEALNKVGSAIGTGAADFKDFVSEAFFGPRYSMRFFIVNFAGGVKHAIPIKSQEFPLGVDEAGLFSYGGTKYRMKEKKTAAGATEYWAFKP